MCLTGVILEVRRLFHLSGALHRLGYDRGSRKLIVHENRKESRFRRFSGGSRGPWIVRSASEGPENAELG